MAKRDEGELGDTSGRSAWESDDIPVPDRPTEFHWRGEAAASARTDAGARPGIDHGLDAGSRTPPEFESATSQGETQAAEPPWQSNRGRAFIAIGLVVVVGVVVAFLTRSDGADDAATSRVDDSTAEVTPTDSSDDTDDGAPATTVSRVPETTEADSSGIAPGEAFPDAIALPPAVAAVAAPTEVVLVTDDDVAYSLSLPSGRVRAVALDGLDGRVGGSGFVSSSLVVAPDAASLGMIGDQFVMLPRSGSPIVVDMDEFDADALETYGWRRAEDGSTQFRVMVFDEDQRMLTVDLDGTVIPADLDPSTTSYGYGTEITTDDGGTIINDAGGAYLVGPDGMTTRIENGVVYGAAGTHRLVRECSEARVCELVLVDEATGERRPIDPSTISDELDASIYGLWLAPDGTAVSMIRPSSGQERVIIDFELGEVVSGPSQYAWNGGSQWAADSSGVFSVPLAEDGIQFFDRSSGTVVPFAQELGRVRAIGVRHPDAELEPESSVRTVAVVPAATLSAETGLEVVGLGRTGDVTAIDLDAGEARVWNVDSRVDPRPALLHGSADRLAVLTTDDSTAFSTTPDGEPGVPLGEALLVDGQKLPGPQPGTLWIEVDEPTTDGGVEYRLVDLAGDAVAEQQIVIPGGALLGADGTGGLVVERAGDIYVATAETVELLTSGELVAIGPTTAFARECDATLACAIWRVDRASGTRSVADSWFPVDALEAVGPGRGAALASTVSPDGAVMLIRIPIAGDDGREMTWLLLDTTNDNLTPVEELDANQPVVWNADGTFAALLIDDELKIFDRTAGRMIDLDGVDAMRAIGQAPDSWFANPDGG